MASKSHSGKPAFSKKLKLAANSAVREVLALKKDERVLIITNPEHDVHTISLAVAEAARGVGAVPIVAVQPVKSQMDFAEPAVLGAIRTNPDVVVSISAKKLGKDADAMKKPYKAGGKNYDHIFNYLLRTKKIRSFWSPSVTLDMFERTVPIDYRWMRATAAKLKAALDKAESINVEAPGGTNLFVGLRGRKTLVDDGDFTKPGTGGNLPAGEVFISPELETSYGTLAFDGSLGSAYGALVLKKPVVCTVENGFITKVTGDSNADKYRESMKKGAELAAEFAKDKKITAEQCKEYQRNSTNLGEFGIGLNKAARIVGNILEDEKVYTTCHIAVGTNYDDDAPAMIHYDGLVYKPTITANFKSGTRKVIYRKGELAI